MTQTQVNVKKHDWGLFAGGIALAIIGAVVMFWPGATLVALATLAGVFFVFAGVAEIVGYFAYKGTGLVNGWQVAGGILDLIVGAVFLLNPFWSAAMLPWIAGFMFMFYGIFGIIEGVSLKKYLPGTWGWLVASGIVGIVCGFLFMAFPESFVWFLGIFMIFQGVSMMVLGATTPKVEIEQTFDEGVEDDSDSRVE